MMRNFLKTIFSTEPCKCAEDEKRGEMQQAVKRNKEAVERLNTTINTAIDKQRQLRFRQAMHQ